MDFLHINLHQDMNITNFYSKEELGDEDDVFYQELRRQVLQLTDEDDDDDQDLHENKNPNIVEARKQGKTTGPYRTLKPRCYYDWSGNMEDYAAPAWILNLWRTGNIIGTGVFIPQVVQSRRRNRPRRKKSGGGRTYKKVEQMN